MNEYLTLVEAATLLPGRPHINSVRRWMHEGKDGVKLRSFKMGSHGKRFTTSAWVAEFIGALAASQGIDAAHTEAEAKLDALGVAS